MNKKSSYNWLKEKEYSYITVLNHCGWDSKKVEESMSELITEEEFNNRLVPSRISALFPKGLMEFTD